MSRHRRITDFHEGLLLDSETTGSYEGYRLSGWSSSQSQADRFKALLRAVTFQGGSIIDYGCGTGDLFQFLSDTAIPFGYRGVDGSERMIFLARQRYAGTYERIPYDSAEIGEADYVFASGIFQFLDEEQPEYYAELLARLFEHCRIGLAATFLSSLRDERNKDDRELYLNPAHVCNLGASLSERWTLDHSYHPGRGDMTLGLLKASNGIEWRRPPFGRAE